MRVKVACINWTHSGAPHAVTYVMDEKRGMVAESYHDTWTDAMDRAHYLASIISRAVAS